MNDDPKGDQSLRGEQPSSSAGREAPAGLDEKSTLPDMIGDSLKQYYTNRLSQPIPDKLSALLQMLAEKEGTDGRDP